MEQSEKAFKVRITLTMSKLLSLIVLLGATAISYVTKDASVFSNSLPVVTLLVLGRQGFNTLKEVKAPKQ